MNTNRIFTGIAVAGMAFLFSLSSQMPVIAQDGPPQVRGHVIIKGPDGVQEFDLDPSQLPLLSGGGNQMMILRVGPDGQVFSFAGGPEMLGGLSGPGGAGGVRLLGPNGVPFLGGVDIIDPGRSYIFQLIKRDDVRAQLLTTGRQREALDAMDKNQQEAGQQQIKQNVLNLGGDLQGKSPEELRQFMAERAKKMQEQMQGMASEREKKLAAILTPAQIKRLKELDMQWRGPLSMGVKEVSDQAKLTSEQSPKVTDLLKQYRKEVNQQLSSGFRPASLTLKSGGGAASGSTEKQENAQAALTPAEMQAKMERAKKEIEKARKSLGEKALSTLAEEQRAQWSSLTGKSFQFRAAN